MKQLLILAAIALNLFISCTKNNEACSDKNPSKNAGWLKEKKQELSPCACLTEIRQGTWQGETVFEIRGVDPLCNGINKIYNKVGFILFYSGPLGSDNYQKYQDYLQNNQNDKLLWSCSEQISK